MSRDTSSNLPLRCVFRNLYHDLDQGFRLHEWCQYYSRNGRDFLREAKDIKGQDAWDNFKLESGSDLYSAAILEVRSMIDQRDRGFKGYILGLLKFLTAVVTHADKKKATRFQKKLQKTLCSHVSDKGKTFVASGWAIEINPDSSKAHTKLLQRLYKACESYIGDDSERRDEYLSESGDSFVNWAGFQRCVIAWVERAYHQGTFEQFHGNKRSVVIEMYTMACRFFYHYAMADRKEIARTYQYERAGATWYWDGEDGNAFYPEYAALDTEVIDILEGYPMREDIEKLWSSYIAPCLEEYKPDREMLERFLFMAGCPRKIDEISNRVLNQRSGTTWFQKYTQKVDALSGEMQNQGEPRFFATMSAYIKGQKAALVNPEEEAHSESPEALRDDLMKRQAEFDVEREDDPERSTGSSLPWIIGGGALLLLVAARG